jgi:chromosome segregation ATPase
MLSKLIENTLYSVNIDTITDIFIVTILLLLVLSVIWTKQNKHHEFTSYAPSLLTSVGILGTFTGIVVGLLSFNVNDIDGSITHLLAGLKVAFITSLVGMLSSIILKFLTSSHIITPEKKDIKEDITIKDLYSVMDSQNKNIIKVQELLSDNDDSSLVGQIKLMRSDINDNNKITVKSLGNIIEPLMKIESKQSEQTELFVKSIDKISTILEANNSEQKESFNKFSKDLWVQLENFADILSKSATEQIIEALKNVIAEFNDKLTEQFGQNFKELNSAVKDLVAWQNNYKEQLGEMKDQFNLSVNSISDMEKSIESISTNSKSIPDSMSNLEKVINTNQHQVDELSNHLKAFKDIRDKAVEAVPEIRTQIDTTIKGIHEASLGLIEGVTSSTEKISSVIVQSADDFANNVNATNGALVESSNTLTSSSTEIKEQLNLTIQDINKYLREMIENLSVSSKDISSNFKDISISLESELSKTNTHMVDNLKLVTDNFANSSKDISKTLLNTSSELQNSIESLSKEQQKETKKVLNSLDENIKDVIKTSKQDLSEQVKNMNKITETEITNVMESLGGKLGAITKKFTKDYQVLVQEMQRVIESNR